MSMKDLGRSNLTMKTEHAVSPISTGLQHGPVPRKRWAGTVCNKANIRTQKQLYDGPFAFLLIQMIQVIQVIQRSGFYTCPKKCSAFLLNTFVMRHIIVLAC